MRITKVYTKGGDLGETALVGGERVGKNHFRIQAYGTLDELNAIIGLVRTFLDRTQIEQAKKTYLDTMLYQIQNDLFNVGADLATPVQHRWKGMIRINNASTKQLEEWIDKLNDDLEPLKEFILPGGGPVGGFFHQARTVCRRAEREIYTCLEHIPEQGTEPMKYVNRLSDFLFVAGRWSAKEIGEKEYFWQRTVTPNGADDK